MMHIFVDNKLAFHTCACALYLLSCTYPSNWHRLTPSFSFMLCTEDLCYCTSDIAIFFLKKEATFCNFNKYVLQDMDEPISLSRINLKIVMYLGQVSVQNIQDGGLTSVSVSPNLL